MAAKRRSSKNRSLTGGARVPRMVSATQVAFARHSQVHGSPLCSHIMKQLVVLVSKLKCQVMDFNGTPFFFL